MSEALKSLNNIRTLRARGRELPLEVLEEILEKLNVIVDERRQEESSKAAELQARQEKLDALRKLMEEDGINPEELLGSFQPNLRLPRKAVNHARPNTHLLMKMAKQKRGLDRAVPPKLWQNKLQPVKVLMIS